MSRLVLVVALIIAVCGACVPAARAATFNVTVTTDAGDAAPGNGACATAAGQCTLRAALEESNALAGPDLVRFTLATPATINLTIGSLLATGSVTIDGPGSLQLTINGSAINNQVLVLNPGGAAIETYAVDGLRITGGFLDGGTRAGGGIQAAPDTGTDQATVTLTDVVLSGNEVVSGGATPALGGGLWMGRGTLTATDCRFESNTLSGNGNDFAGAGVYIHDATALIERCEIIGNRMPEGLGVGLRVREGTTTVLDTAINDNDVTVGSGPDSFGGGLAIGTGAGTPATVIVRRSTAGSPMAVAIPPSITRRAGDHCVPIVGTS